MEEKLKEHIDKEFNFVSACEDLGKSCVDIIKTYVNNQLNNELQFNEKFYIVNKKEHCRCIRYCYIDRIIINQYDEISLYVIEDDEIDIEEINFNSLFYEDMMLLTSYIINTKELKNEI